MFQPLDYVFEILIVICALYGTVIAYVNYFKTDTNTVDGQKLLEAYIELERVKCKKQRE